MSTLDRDPMVPFIVMRVNLEVVRVASAPDHIICVCSLCVQVLAEKTVIHQYDIVQYSALVCDRLVRYSVVS